MIKSIIFFLLFSFGLNASFSMESRTATKKVDLGDTLLFQVVNGANLGVDIYRFEFISPTGVPLMSASVDHSTPIKIKEGSSLFPVYLKDCCVPFEGDVYGQHKKRLGDRYQQIVRPVFVSIWPGSNGRLFSYAVPQNKVQLIKREWVYFLLPGTKPHNKPFDIFICQSLPHYDYLKYVLLDDNQSLFNILPQELKSLIVLSTLILEDLST